LELQKLLGIAFSGVSVGLVDVDIHIGFGNLGLVLSGSHCVCRKIFLVKAYVELLAAGGGEEGT
jgi:hypothetical protein